MVLFVLLGIGYEEPFGISHPKYWKFEGIMAMSFLIMGLLVLWIYFRGVELNDDWLLQSLRDGAVVMVVQFALDFFVIVLLFGSGMSYFYGMVTVQYLLIPFWTSLVAYFVHSRTL